MQLSKKSIETLIDLVEIKLGTMEVWDREDKRAVRDLQNCLKELSSGGTPRRLPSPEPASLTH